MQSTSVAGMAGSFDVRGSESLQRASIWPKLSVMSLSRDSTMRGAIAAVDPFALRPDADRPFMEERSHSMSSSVPENDNGDE